MVKVDEFNLPEDLYYYEEGRSWAKIEPDGRVRVGLSDVAVKMAAEIIYIRLNPKAPRLSKVKASERWRALNGLARSSRLFQGS